MQLQQLIYFVTVAEQGSINKAAEKLFVTQPNLSKAIMNLESELKIKIFDRNNKGATLTEQGKKLYQYSQTILNQIDLISRISSKEAPRILSIASYPIITMARLMSEYYNQSSKDICLSLTEQRLQRVVESVENRQDELGFIMCNNIQVKELKHMLNYKNLEYNIIGKDTWYANIGSNNPLYNKSEVTMNELLAYPIVRMQDDYFSNLTFYLEISGIKLTEFKKVIYANDSAAIISMLNYTEAIRFGPGLSKTDFEKHGIKTIPIANCNVEIDVGWIRRKKELLSDEAKKFVKLLEALYPLSL